MRTTKLIGLGMVIAGAVLITVGSGAFDANEASRGMAIETAEDEGAFLGVEYPEEEPVELESSDATGGGGCVFFACADFEYDGITVVVLTDNSGGLTVDSIETEVNNDDITGGDGVRDESSAELREVVGDFRCPSSGFFGTGTQGSREGVVTVDVQTSGGVGVEIEREVEVECIPD